MPAAGSWVVFIVSGETDIARVLARLLVASGYSARLFERAEEAVAAGESHPPDLFLLGTSPPDDAADICRSLRSVARFVKVPIIVVGRASESERIAALEAGSDDYLGHPVGARELTARVKAVLRRYAPPKTEEVIRVGVLTIDRLAMSVESEGQPVALTTTEFRLLEQLARHRGRVLSREQLLAVVWRGAEHVTPRAIDVYVRRVRAKIERDPENPVYLTTVRGTGYRLSAPGGTPPHGER